MKTGVVPAGWSPREPGCCEEGSAQTLVLLMGFKQVHRAVARVPSNPLCGKRGATGVDRSSVEVLGTRRRRGSKAPVIQFNSTSPTHSDGKCPKY